MDDQTKTVPVTDISVVYEQDKAMIDMQVATAKTYPRNLGRCIDSAISLVTLDKEIASTCTYALPRGGKSISGPSVHLAKILAQLWGNLRAEAKVVDIAQKQITAQAVCWDLENNLAIKVEVKRSILGKHGRYNDDMITVTGNAANSIALRNAIFAVIPKQVVDKVWASAKNTVLGDVSDEQQFIATKNNIIKKMTEAYNVSEQEVFALVGKPSLTTLTQDDLVALIGIGQAIRDGETTVDRVFGREKKQGATLEDVMAAMELFGQKLSKAEMVDAKRIINTSETASFEKLIKLLHSKNVK